MHINGNMIYLIGGYVFKNNIATKIYPLNEITRVILSEKETYQVDTVVLHKDPELAIPWTTGFGVCGSEENIVIFSGNIYPEYNSEKENFYEFLPPKTSRNILPPKSELLLKVNLSGQSISAVVSPKEAGGNCPVVKILEPEGPTLVIVSDPCIWLQSPAFKFEAEVCDLEEEYGSCKLKIQSDNKAYICIVPKCSSKIHLQCDVYIRGKATEKVMCPSCRDIDPRTGKKRPKIPSGRGRGRPKTVNK